MALRDVIALILTYEGRWPLAMYDDRSPELLRSARAGTRGGRPGADAGGTMRRPWNGAPPFGRGMKAFAGRTDGFITLNQIDPAPVGMPVGDAVYGEPSSVAGCPALNLPLLSVQGNAARRSADGLFSARTTGSSRTRIGWSTRVRGIDTSAG